MNNFTDPKHLRTKQYHNATRLNARINLHKRFSTNTYPWHSWLFDQYDLPDQARILEIGCGPGDLWAENQAKVSQGWKLVLSDLSDGMANTAKGRLKTNHFTFANLDCQNIPFPSEHFDAVIANHMLYHVPEPDRAYQEIHRVLRPSGKLYAATNGENHMIELMNLINEFDPTIKYQRPYLGFTLENGRQHLSPWFTNIQIQHYISNLEITEAEPLAEYYASMESLSTENIKERVTELTAYLQTKIDKDSVIHISKSVGVITAQKAK